MKWLREFLYLHKSDRRVLLVLLTLAAIVLSVVWLAGEKDGLTEAQDSLAGAHDLQAEPQGRTNQEQYVAQTDNSETGHETETLRTELFPFDPNTADSTQLLRLGLSSHIVRNICKYRAKGGVFRKKKDFAKLYGLTVKQYHDLEPFIRISDDYLPAATLFNENENDNGNDNENEKGNENGSGRRYPVKIAEGETVDLNLSDTTILKTVPGIGSYYARRIAEYGKRLGGYVSTSQLAEIEDFPTEATAFFQVSQPHPQQLHINRLSLNQLKQHPYINYYMARAIVDYRRQHGPVKDLHDLRLLPDFTPEAIERLKPYVSYD